MFNQTHLKRSLKAGSPAQRRCAVAGPSEPLEDTCCARSLR
jgi:hypothetical protein